MDIMNLQMATIAHLQWKSKLSDFFYGVEDLSHSQVPDHCTCDFGKWLNASGLQEFSIFPEMRELVPLHKDIHDRIKHMVQMPKEIRKSDTGKKALKEFKAKCDKFVQLLETVETQAKSA
ncbi:MAG: hypothetical protein D3917_13150 [Candidatus Electrothrix sp. AX5]|jgi:methyl-accepting chemotaxis protein|uniref:Chemoreceptor zinc-binding domain-containing protein n=1 Tax=Candidatus Electrothrix aarhusensis TaxID=1859131 RepID=A0A444IY51_9BACT|nr:hypothetical protein [Candidatus Electrothrix sp. AX5]RWX45595.1 Chemoreceptor zinc-binding domain-containing protein [Candidatus Electrothrix aarhusensis]